MRIAMFMPSLGPDALGWKVHRDFAEAVEELGHRFLMLTTPRTDGGQRGRHDVDERSERGVPRGSDDGDTPVGVAATGGAAANRDRGDDNGVVVLPVPSSSAVVAELARPFLRTRQLLPAAGALAPWLRQHGDEIDLLHLEVAYPHGTAGMLGARRAGWRGPVALTPMGEDVLVVRDRSYGMRRHTLPAALVRRTLRGAAALRCISPMFERHIAALSPRNPRRVIPLNISAEAAAAASMDDEERTRFRAAARATVDGEFGTGGRPIVLSFGRLHPFKGIDYLIEAAATIGDATVLVIGPSATVRPFGDVAESLRQKARDVGVSDKVEVARPVHPARAPEVLAAADVVVVPSPLESLNKVCMEAAAVGTPFVVTETTGISAWVPDEGIGIVVPPRNVPAIAWAIEEIVGGHFIYDAGAAARFARRFTPQRIAADVMDFYQEIVGPT
jgi:glycosyltransferase involved in cell wall biosynthesis